MLWALPSRLSSLWYSRYKNLFLCHLGQWGIPPSAPWMYMVPGSVGWGTCFQEACRCCNPQPASGCWTQCPHIRVGGGWLESIKHPWIPVCLHPLCSPCMAHLSDWLSIVVRGEQNLEKTAAPVAKMSLKEWGSWDAPGKWNAALKEWVMHQSQLWLAALVQRTKKFKIMGISRGQRQERKDADQNITWRLLTMLFNRGYILMKWNILSLT